MKQIHQWNFNCINYLLQEEENYYRGSEKSMSLKIKKYAAVTTRMTPPHNFLLS